jgi:hypothetical protein
MALKGQLLKRLRKKAKRGMRRWPLATVAFYARTRVALLRDPVIAAAMLEFMDKHGVLSVVMSDELMGCPHQEGID